MTIGDRIKYFRKQRGYSQLELADLTGLHHVTIRKYEANMRTPQADHLHRVATALDVNHSALIGIDKYKFAFNTVGDLLGIIITLCQTRVIKLSGERDTEGLFRLETTRIVLSEKLHFYVAAKVEQTDDFVELPIGKIAFALNISDALLDLLHWEREYSRVRALQNAVYNCPTPELLEELSECRNRKEILELELQSRKENLMWPDGLVGDLM